MSSDPSAVHRKPRQPVELTTLFNAWGRMLRGHSPLLSIEITRECPLHCPGCYAYEPMHLGGGITLRQVHDLHGDPLIGRVLDLIRSHRPVQVSFVGGEPLVRHRELSRILPAVSDMSTLSSTCPSRRAWHLHHVVPLLSDSRVDVVPRRLCPRHRFRTARVPTS